MKPSERIQRPDFDVPDLTKRQQEDMNLPADFWDAFDEHFWPALLNVGVAEDYFAAKAKFSRLTVIQDPQQTRGWQISVDDEAVTLRRKGQTIRYTDRDVRDALHDWHQAEKVLSRRAEFDQICHSGKPVWSFLPVRQDRQDAELEAGVVEAELRRREESKPPMSSAPMKTSWLWMRSQEEIGRLRNELDRLHSLARWPGDEEPPLP